MVPQRNKKLLYILLFFIAILIIPAVYVAFLYVRELRSDASDKVPPKNVQIFNRADNSVDIAWMTEAPTTGKVRFTGASTGEAVDIRGESYSGNSHIIKLRGLSPSSSYEFTVISGGKEYDKATVFTLKTVLTEPKSFAGTAKTSDQRDMADTLVKAYLIEKGSGDTVKNITTLGTATAQNGTWTLDAGNFRTDTGEKVENLNNYLITVEVIGKNGAIIARTISPDIGAGQSIALYESVLDDPVKVASAYTAPTVRETTTPTPSIPSTPNPTGSTATITPTVQPTQLAAAQVTNAQIVNQLDGSFAVIWETNIPTNSYVSYTIDGQNKTNAFDKRSNEKLSRSLRTHFVEIVDTANPAGTKYEITLINNGVSWKDKITHEKIDMAESPSVESVKLTFEKTGNYIDQIILAQVPGKSTKVATTPNAAGVATLDLAALRDAGDTSKKHSLSSSDNLTFTLLGGTLVNKDELDDKPASTLKASSATTAVDSTPKDLTPFKILYINIEDGAVLSETMPDFFGEGFQPSSNLQIQIEKQ